jgi:hypothetical protein
VCTCVPDTCETQNPAGTVCDAVVPDDGCGEVLNCSDVDCGGGCSCDSFVCVCTP